MQNIIFSFIAIGGAVFCDFFVVDLSAAMTIALALTGLLAAATNGDVEEIRRLLKNKEDPNQVDKDGKTALMWAAYGGHSEAAEVLLDHNADLHQKDNNGVTALRHAAVFGHPKVTQVLFNYDKERKQAAEQGKEILRVGINSGHTEFVQVLLNNGMAPTDKNEWKILIDLDHRFGGNPEIEAILKKAAGKE